MNKDIFGRAAKAISKELGVRPARGELHLIEVRRGQNAVSYIAHSERKYVELALARDGGITLIETDCAALKQIKTTVPKPGAQRPVEQFTQAWCPRGDAVDAACKVALPNEDAARHRVQRLAWRVSLLAKKNGR